MNIKRPSLLCPLLLAALALPSFGQDVGRVSPASLPLPLPAAAPMPPDRLRAHNPWNLPMTGTWRFALTHGHIQPDKQYQSDEAGMNGMKASSTEDKNLPQNAFDGSNDTRWCASDNSFPQWLQADMGKTRHVSGVSLTWENAGGHYQCRIEGGKDGKHWTTLADDSAAPGIGDGPVTMPPADVRYVRVNGPGDQRRRLGLHS